MDERTESIDALGMAVLKLVKAIEKQCDLIVKQNDYLDELMQMKAEENAVRKALDLAGAREFIRLND